MSNRKGNRKPTVTKWDKNTDWNEFEMRSEPFQIVSLSDCDMKQ